MIFEAADTKVIVEGSKLMIKSIPPLKRRLTLFYIGIFLWFIYLFLKRILRIPTSPFWDWFMLLFLGAILIFYILGFIVRMMQQASVTKYNIRDIITAGVMERDGCVYAVFQSQNEKNVVINFVDDSISAKALIAALCDVNKNIIRAGDRDRNKL